MLAITAGGSLLRSWSPVWGLFTTLWILLPLLTLATLRATAGGAGENAVESLQLRPPHPRYALGALALAPALALLAASLHDWERSLSLFAFVDSSPVKAADLNTRARLLLLALSPAVTEELFFRGALLSALRRGFPYWVCAVLEGVFFGAAHVTKGSLLPAALLGVVLTVLALRSRSLLPPVLMHGAYNALLVFSADIDGPVHEKLAWLAIVGMLLVAWPNAAAPNTEDRH